MAPHGVLVLVRRRHVTEQVTEPRRRQQGRDGGHEHHDRLACVEVGQEVPARTPLMQKGTTPAEQRPSNLSSRSCEAPAGPAPRTQSAPCAQRRSRQLCAIPHRPLGNVQGRWVTECRAACMRCPHCAGQAAEALLRRWHLAGCQCGGGRNRLVVTVHDIDDRASHDPRLGFGVNVHRQRERLHVRVLLEEFNVLYEERG